MADLSGRSDADVAFDLLKYVVERMPVTDKPKAEKDVLALYARCKVAVAKAPVG
jgi:hypothetical protein